MVLFWYAESEIWFILEARFALNAFLWEVVESQIILHQFLGDSFNHSITDQIIFQFPVLCLVYVNKGVFLAFNINLPVQYKEDIVNLTEI